jgi:hypothetical protein
VKHTLILANGAQMQEPTNPNNVCHQTNTYITSANKLTILNNPKKFLEKKKDAQTKHKKSFIDLKNLTTPNTFNFLHRNAQPPA